MKVRVLRVDIYKFQHIKLCGNRIIFRFEQNRKT